MQGHMSENDVVFQDPFSDVWRWDVMQAGIAEEKQVAVRLSQIAEGGVMNWQNDGCSDRTVEGKASEAGGGEENDLMWGDASV